MFNRRDDVLLSPMPSRRREWPALVPPAKRARSRVLASFLALALGGGLAMAAKLSMHAPIGLTTSDSAR